MREALEKLSPTQLLWLIITKDKGFIGTKRAMIEYILANELFDDAKYITGLCDIEIGGKVSFYMGGEYLVQSGQVIGIDHGSKKVEILYYDDMAQDYDTVELNPNEVWKSH